MKIVYEEQLLEIGSAALRCARWAHKHSNDKDRFLVGYHMGKAYAYLYMLSDFGLVRLVGGSAYVRDKQEALSFYHKGKVHIFPGLFDKPTIVMDRKFFDKILTSKQNQQGPLVSKEIVRLCKVIY